MTPTFRDYQSIQSSRVKQGFVGQPGPLKVGPSGSPETSVSNHLTLRKNLADGRLDVVFP